MVGKKQILDNHSFWLIKVSKLFQNFMVPSSSPGACIHWGRFWAYSQTLDQAGMAFQGQTINQAYYELLIIMAAKSFITFSSVVDPTTY